MKLIEVLEGTSIAFDYDDCRFGQNNLERYINDRDDRLKLNLKMSHEPFRTSIMYICKNRYI